MRVRYKKVVTGRPTNSRFPLRERIYQGHIRAVKYKCYVRKFINSLIGILKASALWVDSFYKSKCPYVCVCVCSLFEVPFKHLFAPPSQSPMSKLFKFLKSLGKSYGKKWSNIWKLLLIKGVKSLRIKIFFFFFFFFCEFCRIFLVSVLLSALVERFYVSHMRYFLVNCLKAHLHLKFFKCFFLVFKAEIKLSQGKLVQTRNSFLWVISKTIL